MISKWLLEAPCKVNFLAGVLHLLKLMWMNGHWFLIQPFPSYDWTCRTKTGVHWQSTYRWQSLDCNRSTFSTGQCPLWCISAAIHSFGNVMRIRDRMHGQPKKRQPHMSRSNMPAYHGAWPTLALIQTSHCVFCEPRSRVSFDPDYQPVPASGRCIVERLKIGYGGKRAFSVFHLNLRPE